MEISVKLAPSSPRITYRELKPADTFRMCNGPDWTWLYMKIDSDHAMCIASRDGADDPNIGSQGTTPRPGDQVYGVNEFILVQK